MNEGMRVSQKGISLVKEFEGLYLNAYQDSVGVWTIGYGHTQGVYSSMRITEKQAEEFLANDLLSHATGIFKFVTVQLNQNQFDALASFHFNLGAYILQGSTLLTYINNKNWMAAASEMKRYVYAGGVVLQGLVRRREAESKLFLEATPQPTRKGETTMQCFFKPDNENTVYYFDGKGITPITNSDEMNMLNAIYKENNGKEMPYIKRTGAWFTRLKDASKRSILK